MRNKKQTLSNKRLAIHKTTPITQDGNFGFYIAKQVSPNGKVGRYLKLGFSKNIKERARQLTWNGPFSMELIYAESFNTELQARIRENDMKSLLSTYRVIWNKRLTEWLDLDAGVLDYLKGLLPKFDASRVDNFKRLAAKR